MQASMTVINAFSIRDFGAVADRTTLATAAIQAAVDAAHAAGGGTAYCPPGDYLTGTVELKSNVALHLEAGATLWCSTQRADFRSVILAVPPNFASYGPEHLIFAHNAENVAITGRGTIQGQGEAFWDPPVPGQRKWTTKDWRPTQMIAFSECRNVLIEGITIRNTPGYAIWPLGCDCVRIHGIRIFNNFWGPNTDGIDPDCCRGVIISDCHIEAGDDCIAIKSNGDKLGAGPGERPCEDVTVTNCTLVTRCCAVRIGYEGDQPIRNCTFSNLVIPRTRTGINMLVPRHEEINILHGPPIENISFSNIVMDTQIAFFLWIGDEAAAPGGIRNISISNVRATTERGCYFGGSRTLPIENVRLSDIDLTVRGPMDDKFAETVPYPYHVFDYWGNWSGIPHGIYCRYVRGMDLSRVRVRWGDVSGQWRSALRCEQVEDFGIDGFVASQAPGANASAIHLTDASGVFLHGCRAESGTGTFLSVDGAGSRRISVMGNDLAAAVTPMKSADGVCEGTWTGSIN